MGSTYTSGGTVWMTGIMGLLKYLVLHKALAGTGMDSPFGTLHVGFDTLASEPIILQQVRIV